MKILPTKLLVPLLVGGLGVLAFAETTQQLLSEGQTAYLRGDLEKAKRNFELVVQIEPRNTTAIGYLRMIKARTPKGGDGAEQQKQLAAVILPQVQFREATLGAALEFLKQQVSKVSGGKTAVNFVVQLPEEAANTTKVTLNLNNVPVTEVLRYIGTLANVTFIYEKFAVVVRPAAPAAATATSATQATQ